MSSCEKCWKDSGGDCLKYAALLKTSNCSPEEEAGGKDASKCDSCRCRTIHIHTDKCTNPNCKTNLDPAFLEQLRIEQEARL